MKIEYKRLKEFADVCVNYTPFGIEIHRNKFQALLQQEIHRMGVNYEYFIVLNTRDNCFDIKTEI